MTTCNKQFEKRRGAALILVIVVTVLLAVIGVMFLMVSRLSEMETAAVANSRDLDAGVEAVVGQINQVLIDSDTKPVSYDFGSNYLPWLASLEPVWSDAGPDGATGTVASVTDDIYKWPKVTDLWGTLQDLYVHSLSGVRWIDPDNTANRTEWDQAAEWDDWQVKPFAVEAKVIAPSDRMDIIAVDLGSGKVPASWQTAAADTDVRLFGARADADGDGVADSRWVQVPNLTSAKGQPIFAAIRIIDNCAMLNLNTATCFDVRGYKDAKKTSPFAEAWGYWDSSFTSVPWYDAQTGSGRYLTEVNYLPFLRGRDLNGDFFAGSGGDFWYNLMTARGLFRTSAGSVYPYEPRAAHAVAMNTENAGNGYLFFDLADELELRNRHLLTSNMESRFERADVANFTLDSGGGAYSALQVPRDKTNDFSDWTRRIDPGNFDNWSGHLSPTGGSNPYTYDRRHVCTFYSADRCLPTGDYSHLLDSQIASLGLSADEAELAKGVFRPVGAVTTNLETPAESYTYDDSGFSVGYVYKTSMNNLETRRKLIHLLFGIREYYLGKGDSLSAAAQKAAQLAANIIDYSDSTGANGPFAETPAKGLDYGTQLDQDCTVIDEDIVQDMINEVSSERLITPILPNTVPFGLGTNIVYGYERQPFISEVVVRWASSGSGLVEIAVELVNPYDSPINVKDWVLRIGDQDVHTFTSGQTIPAYSSGIGRAVVTSDSAPAYPGIRYSMALFNKAAIEALIFSPTSSVAIQLLRPAPSGFAGTPAYLLVDAVSDSALRTNMIMGVDGNNALKRDDTGWNFIFADYEIQHSVLAPINYTETLGLGNAVTLGRTGFQLAVADDEMGMCRWHELETLAEYGNPAETGDPNSVITNQMLGGGRHFDLEADDSVLDYICMMNRPDEGTLPGRININTAPVHVIAAAIPPTLADPNAADPTEVVILSSLDLAQKIVNGRPYQKVSDLLAIPEFKQYTSGGSWTTENVGQQSIEDDIEEEHWVLSNLANKFTVRSDVFTAYILVRLGEDGPQRRMIAIFDRSNVWQAGDQPQLVALHPVPDPR